MSIAWHKKKTQESTSGIEMVPIASGTKPNRNVRIQEDVEEKIY